MENNIEMIENILNTERRNRRGNREIRFEVNSNYYKAVSKLLSDYKRALKENEELGKFITEGIEIKTNSPYKDDSLEFLRNNFIPVQKVKDTVDKIQEEGYWLFTTNNDSNKCVEVLQQLLEEKQ